MEVSGRGGDEAIFTDKSLEISPDRGLVGLRIFLDPDYLTGSLALEMQFAGIGIFRILSTEEQPDPRRLIDKFYEFKHGNMFRKWPVTIVAVGDIEVVHLGLGVNQEDSYRLMRRYRAVRSRLGLYVAFEGLETIDPNSLVFRDGNPAPPYPIINSSQE